jgi:hypothetical protein
MTTDTNTKSPQAAAVPPGGPAPAKKRVTRGHRRLLTRREIWRPARIRKTLARLLHRIGREADATPEHQAPA